MAETSSNNISSEPEFDIHVATPKDAASIRSLIQELADFEKMPDGPEISADQLAEDLKRGALHSFVAYHKPSGEVAAMTLFYYAYSTWQGQASLFKVIILVTKRLRIEYVPAVLLNKLLGGVDLCESEGWIMYRLDEDRMKNLI
ncbi:diamine acetyltransferase 2 [Ditylenchus destructor]|nr:diamine acetyltransferase 2 [Ditylenchus destructor]